MNLARVDALQIDRSHAETAMAELVVLNDVSGTPSRASSIAWTWRN